MKLNLDFIDEAYVDIAKDDEKKIINNYIDKYDDTNYDAYFGEQISEKEMYYLSLLNTNILNWYPFNPKDSILEVGGGLGQLTGFLADKVKEVVTIEPSLIQAQAIEKRHQDKNNIEIIVGTVDKIKIEKKFDYILLIGIDAKIKDLFSTKIKFKEVLKELEKYLKNDGKFIIAVDNKLGIRYFAGEEESILNKKFASVDNYCREPEEIESFTRSYLEKVLKKRDYNYIFYYPLPDYRLPNVIFSEKCLPDYHTFERYIPYHTENAAIMFNELAAFKSILKEDKSAFKIFTNSFLVEVSKNELHQKYSCISYNNIRKKEYRLMTKIGDDFVEKEIADSKAEEHYNNIKSNIELLEKNNLNTLDSIKDGKIISKYISQEQRLDKVLVQYINDEETQKMEELIEKYTEILFKNTYEENDYNNTIFAKYNIEIEDKSIIKNLHFIKKGLWDLIFQNCFVVDNELYFFDQEWIENSVPAEYVLYRAFYYTIPLRKEFFISEDKFGLKPFIPIFEKLDSQLQQSIFDKKMWDFYYKDKYYNLDATKQEVINLNIQKSALEADRDRYKEELEKVSKAYQQYVDSIRSRKAYKIVKFFRRGKKND